MALDHNGNEQSADAIAFLAEIADVCRRHRLALTHEDKNGPFEVCDYEMYYTDKLQEAVDVRPSAARAMFEAMEEKRMSLKEILRMTSASGWG